VAEPTAAELKGLVQSGAAMPDGSFYIRDENDLSNAIDAVGRAKPTGDESEVARRNAVRKHVIKRANELKMPDKIPDTWNSDGSLKHSQFETFGAFLIGDYLEHFGRKGMKWGAHVYGSDRSGASTHQDAHDTNLLKAKVQQHGTKALSTSELQTLVTRLNVEKQYSNLSPHEVSLGRTVVSELLSETGGVGRNVARQAVTEVAKKYAVKGLEEVIKSATK
jgi:hypothetical protein